MARRDPPIPAWRARELSVAALVAPATITRYLRGQRLYPTTRERVERVLREQAPELLRRDPDGERS
jgi:hypothetical protein